MTERWINTLDQYDSVGVLTAKEGVSTVSCTVNVFQNMRKQTSLTCPPQDIGGSLFVEIKLDLSTFNVLVNAAERLHLKLSDGREGATILNGTFDRRGWTSYAPERYADFIPPRLSVI